MVFLSFFVRLYVLQEFYTVCIRLYDIRKYKESQRTPNFLTWKTKEEIRILYKEDPENWNIERLASKYPVSKASLKVQLNNL
jgi:Neugrin